MINDLEDSNLCKEEAAIKEDLVRYEKALNFLLKRDWNEEFDRLFGAFSLLNDDDGNNSRGIEKVRIEDLEKYKEFIEFLRKQEKELKEDDEKVQDEKFAGTLSDVKSEDNKNEASLKDVIDFIKSAISLFDTRYEEYQAINELTLEEAEEKKRLLTMVEFFKSILKLLNKLVSALKGIIKPMRNLSWQERLTQEIKELEEKLAAGTLSKAELARLTLLKLLNFLGSAPFLEAIVNVVLVSIGIELAVVAVKEINNAGKETLSAKEEKEGRGREESYIRFDFGELFKDKSDEKPVAPLPLKGKVNEKPSTNYNEPKSQMSFFKPSEIETAGATTKQKKKEEESKVEEGKKEEKSAAPQPKPVVNKAVYGGWGSSGKKEESRGNRDCIGKEVAIRQEDVRLGKSIQKIGSDDKKVKSFRDGLLAELSQEAMKHDTVVSSKLAEVNGVDNLNRVSSLDNERSL